MIPFHLFSFPLNSSKVSIFLTWVSLFFCVFLSFYLLLSVPTCQVWTLSGVPSCVWVEESVKWRCSICCGAASVAIPASSLRGVFVVLASLGACVCVCGLVFGLEMLGSGTNLVTTVIGFGMSATFIVFVCTRIICGRLRGGVESRMVYEIESRIDIEQVSSTVPFSSFPLFLFLPVNGA